MPGCACSRFGGAEIGYKGRAVRGGSCAMHSGRMGSAACTPISQAQIKHASAHMHPTARVGMNRRYLRACGGRSRWPSSPPKGCLTGFGRVFPSASQLIMLFSLRRTTYWLRNGPCRGFAVDRPRRVGMADAWEGRQRRAGIGWRD